MAEAKVYTAPETFELSDEIPSLFIAGSIEEGRAGNWQSRVIQELSAEKVIILNPRRSEWDFSVSQTAQNPQIREQIEWELEGLERATHIMIYFSPEARSPITLLELGLFSKSGRLVVGCPDGFWRKANVEIVCERYKIPLCHSYEELVETVRAKVRA